MTLLSILDELVDLLLTGGVGSAKSSRRKALPVWVTVAMLLALAAFALVGAAIGASAGVVAAAAVGLVATVVGVRSRRDRHSPRG